MSDHKEALQQYNAAMNALEQAEQVVQDALKLVRDAARGATVTVDGRFFQVRERRNRLYLCELNGKPRGRPKGSKNKKKVVELAPVEVPVLEELAPAESELPAITAPVVPAPNTEVPPAPVVLPTLDEDVDYEPLDFSEEQGENGVDKSHPNEATYN